MHFRIPHSQNKKKPTPKGWLDLPKEKHPIKTKKIELFTNNPNRHGFFWGFFHIAKMAAFSKLHNHKMLGIYNISHPII